MILDSMQHAKTLPIALRLINVNLLEEAERRRRSKQMAAR